MLSGLIFWIASLPGLVVAVDFGLAIQDSGCSSLVLNKFRLIHGYKPQTQEDQEDLNKRLRSLKIDFAGVRIAFDK